MANCSVSGCDRKLVAKGLCNGHYSRMKRGQALEGPFETHTAGRTCTVDGCSGKHVGKGFCIVHWMRQKNGIPLDQPVREVFETDDIGERLRHYAPEGAPDECWVWTRALNKGYGMISIGNGKLRGAHIVAWELATGESLPKGMVIRHTCDNPPCTNPAHLLVGTHADNVNDRVEHGQPNKGTDNPRAKLTDDDVRTIRRLSHSGMAQKTIAKQFGINQANVSMIVTRQTWKHV